MATGLTTILVSIPLSKAINAITTANGRTVSIIHLQGAEGRECAVAYMKSAIFRMQASSVATVVLEDVDEKIKVSCV